MTCSIATIAIAGCGTPPTLPDLDLSDVEPEPIQQPVAACEWPVPVEIDHDGVEYVAFDVPAFSQILMCQETELANFQIAAANAETAEAYAEILRQGREHLEFLHDAANYKLEQEYERGRDHWLEAKTYQAVAVLLAIAAAL